MINSMFITSMFVFCTGVICSKDISLFHGPHDADGISDGMTQAHGGS